MKILRLIMGTVLVFTICFTALYGKDKIKEEKFPQSQTEYKGVLTLWNIDVFEGGKGARKQFLLEIARDFERKNEGVLVMVTDHTTMSAEENMKKGIFPDMLSYGNGVIIEEKQEININRAYKGGKVMGKTYGVAWCRGGYVLIGNKTITDDFNTENEKIIVSENTYTQPLLAMNMDKIKCKSVEVKSPMESYVKFTGGKEKYFLGTQRDITRLENRNMDIITKPIQNYNDLYQYISVTTKDHIKADMSEKFIEYLIEDESQKKLSKLNMFSPYIEVKYENIHLDNMSKKRENQTVSAFLDRENLYKMQREMKRHYSGEITEINKLKNMLV